MAQRLDMILKHVSPFSAVYVKSLKNLQNNRPVDHSEKCGIFF